MIQNNTDTNGTEQYDHYGKIINAMAPGLLITVNKSGAANARGSAELRVERRISEGEVLLSGHGTSEFVLREETGCVPTLVRIKSIGEATSATPVETIEVIGIDG